MNKKGFVASSILYSFLIVFVALIMTIIANYAHNRVLMNRISDDIKKEVETTNDNDISGAIAPEIWAKFTPITYVDNHWIVANSNNKNATWYNYRDKKWANAVLTSELDKNITEGSVISDETVENYGYVWIPRFRYQIFSSVDGNCIPHNDEGQELTSIPNINVIFEPEEGASGAQGKAIKTYRVPNAFTYYKKDNGTIKSVFTKGFWIKKYPKEVSTTKLFSIKDISTDRENEITSGANIYYAGILMQRTNHIIRNAQWGAVAYLTYSKYGLGTDNADSTTGNETGVYYMNHFNNIENPNYSKKIGELTVYTSIEIESTNSTVTDAFYEGNIFPIDKRPSRSNWDINENSGDAMCETNIKNIPWTFLKTPVDVTFGKTKSTITNYFFIRGYHSDYNNNNGIFTFQATTQNNVTNYYVRDVYENI